MRLSDLGIPVAIVDRIISWLPASIQGLPQGYELSDVIAALVLAPLQLEISSLPIDCIWLNDDFFICARNRMEAGFQIAVVAEVLESGGLIVAADKTELSDGLDALFAATLGHRGGIEISKYFDDDPYKTDSSAGDPGGYGFPPINQIEGDYAPNWERLIVAEFLDQEGSSESVLKEALRMVRPGFVEEHSGQLGMSYPTMTTNTLKVLPQRAQLHFCLTVLREAKYGPWPDGRQLELLSVARRLDGPVRGSSEFMSILMEMANTLPAEVAVNCAVGKITDSRIGARIATTLREAVPLDLRISRVRGIRAMERGIRKDLYESIRKLDPVLELFIGGELASAA